LNHYDVGILGLTGGSMRRRDFIAAIGGATALPLAARAQQLSGPVIGFLGTASPTQHAEQLGAFHQGLKHEGYIEGQNLTVEYRWANDRYERLPALAAELVRRKVAAIVAHGPGVLPAKAATTTIPIVFFTGVDPVATGIVASLNRPGGNLTGVSMLNVELTPKRLELARELAPATTSMAVILNPVNPNAPQVSKEIQATAGILGIKAHVLNARSESDIDSAFTAAVGLKVGAVVIGPDPLFNARVQQFAGLSLRHGVAAIYQYRQFAAAGGVMSYGGSITDLYRQVGSYTGRVLKGAKTAELPIQQSTKAELIINLKTAKALGLTVPETLLARADEVIE
jgi:putative tryptophan/tyrosine transport system substrate-binding protein